MATKQYNNSNVQALVANNQLNNMIDYHIKSSLKIKPKPFDYIKKHFFNERVEKLLSKVQLYEFTDKKIILNLIRGNDKISNLLKQNNIELEINIKNLESITSAHLNPTLEIAYRIMEELSSYFCFSISDKKAIIRGAIFHDFGKVLIPDKILNSKGDFNMALIKVDFLSKYLMRTVSFQAIIPVDNFDETTYNQEVKPFKTLYLLHGIFGNDTDWVSGTRIQAWANDYNLAVIMPAGENKFYLDNNYSGESWSKFIGEELVTFTRKLFPLSNKIEDAA